MISIILAGGIGSRFWPLSTPSNPKQFLPIFDEGKSLYDLAIERVEYLNTEEILTITGQKYEHFVKAKALLEIMSEEFRVLGEYKNARTI